MSLQEHIFRQIISRHDTKSKAIDSLMNLLNTSKASLYRKINNTSSLKPDEITLLAQHYGFSLDELVENNSNQFLFSYITTLFPFVFKGQKHQVEHPFSVDSTDLAVSFFYIGLELPIYYFCYYPELIYFKKHIWERVNIDDHQHNYALINFSDITNQEHSYYNEAIRYYEQIKTTEIWNKKGLSVIIGQIRYSFQVGILNHEDAKMLINLLNRLINRLERMLRVGSKTLDKQSDNLTVYLSPITSADSVYIVEDLSSKFVQASYDTPNSLITTNPNLINNTKKRFNSFKRQSHIISIAGEMQRQGVLQDYRTQLNRLMLQLDF